MMRLGLFFAGAPGQAVTVFRWLLPLLDVEGAAA